MKITRVGVDLAKKVFQVHGVDAAGRRVWQRELKRSSSLSVLSEAVEPGCEIGMEACGGAHHWARELKSRGFECDINRSMQHIEQNVQPVFDILRSALIPIAVLEMEEL